MTPEELDAIEAAYREHAPECPFPGEKVMDALREAWAERDALQNWKVGALGVLSEWEFAWELLGRPGGLGSSKAHASVTAISDLIVRAERAEAALDQANALLLYALRLCMYGERAPGGNETWKQFYRDCEEYLRAIEGES